MIDASADLPLPRRQALRHYPQGSFERADRFYVLMFALAEFELGFGFSPFIPGQRAALEIERVFAGIGTAPK